ncbi:SGNH/GDSL hydrolase family protein [Phycisphaera mikurensis]|uniref:PA14 domain-containing protein n=1 Tax=Phycisphaera mikurensis (strain NBRC 102666 / KCTC 22515 / FYK2301M01) TaxID=1142394 RepID=I0IIG7_PHYMF|nr:SGNH/GDSL hydrolase family protein [Phycisphaera mikurensis]MBB6442789.1 lysophospholipase L1-like esterase [Phycisphaera mikurensis]BAM05055.1 hypothetical protein PSMK_28960 [Phycisphaera mikurensis NBRC 102666]
MSHLPPADSPAPAPRDAPARDAGPGPAPLEPLEKRELLSGGPQILTIGDSITWGSPDPSQSYRRELDRGLERRGVDAEFVGSRSDGRGFDSDHYSQPGITAATSYRGSGGEWRGSLNDGFRSGQVLKRGEKPDLVLLHIGTNSVKTGSRDADNAANELRTLLNTMADRWRRGELAPDVKVLVADIIPGGRGSGGGGGHHPLDTRRLENIRAYNGKIGQVIGRLSDRGFASRIQRVDMSRIDASRLDRSAFSSSELRSIDNDGDRWVDWFNGVDEGGSQRGARGHNPAVMSRDLLHPTSLGYRVLGQAWLGAVVSSGKLGNAGASRPLTPTAPAPRPSAPKPAAPRPVAPTPKPVAGKPSLSGAGTATAGSTYRLALDDGGLNVRKWYVDFGDGSGGRWLGPTDSVSHTYQRAGSNPTIRAFAEVNGKRIGASGLRVGVVGGGSHAAPKPAPKPGAPASPRPAPAPSGGVAIAAASSATVGRSFEVVFSTNGVRADSWYISWGDGSKGRWIKGADRVSHTFTSTSGNRTIRAFAQVGSKRIGASPLRVPVRAAGQGAAPTPSKPSTPPIRSTGDGRIDRAYWTGIGGTRVSDLTRSSKFSGRPTGTDTLTSLRAGNWNNPRDTQNFGSHYGQKLSGFIVAPRSGQYSFWISGDDNASFRLSTDASTSRLREVARVDGWTRELQWDKYRGQRSASIWLSAGSSYAFEVLHKEGSGGDHVAVGWRTPDHGGGRSPAEVIGSDHLSRYAV